MPPTTTPADRIDADPATAGPRRRRPGAVGLAALASVVAEPGKPLYKTVRQSLLQAIDAGAFPPGQRLPSTKELSRQMAVSLVTAHRALQELVGTGVLERTQGRGTFVIERSRRVKPRFRVAVVMQPQASMADYYHSQIIEGMRQAAAEHGAELVIARHPTDTQQACDAYLLVNPAQDDPAPWIDGPGRGKPVLTVGARGNHAKVTSFDVDNRDLAVQAVDHLTRLGHKRIAFVGGVDDLSNSRDRREGFTAACAAHGLERDHCPVLAARSWRLDPRERMKLNRLLRGHHGENAPTAVFAAGYYFALDCYDAAGSLGLRIPDDLSVVGVDDPPSAPYLSPGLTTFAQPLTELGHEAVAAVLDRLQRDLPALPDQTLRADLVIRASTTAPVLP